MKFRLTAISFFAFVLTSCATPPKSNPAVVESGCAQQCSANLATCSAGFKMFPIVQQKQCNDTYDVCIKGCPARTSTQATAVRAPSSAEERLKQLDALYKSGAISQSEYEAKRKEILGSL